MKFRWVITICSLVVFLGSCKGESALPIVRESSYREVMNAVKHLSPEQLERLYRECPRPSGVFNNDATDGKNSRRLDYYFRVDGFVVPATLFRGGKDGDEPVPVNGKPIDIITGIEKDGFHFVYFPKEHIPPEKGLVLELRPLGHGRFNIGIRSGVTGRSGESDKGWFDLSINAARCENGVLKGFWGSKAKDTLILGWELFVDADTGDILLRFPQVRPQTPEGYYRFKRINK